MRRGVSLLILAFLAATLAAASARADSGAATTTTTGTTTTTPTQAYEPLVLRALPKNCVGAGIAVIEEPGLSTFAIGTPAAAHGVSGYPAANPVFTFDSSTVSGSTCKNDSVTLNNVSLFGGAVTATSVTATDGKGAVTGLAIGGASVTATAGHPIAVGNWGRLSLGVKAGRLTAPLAIHLLKARASLEKGTTVLLGFAAVRQPAVKKQPAAQPKSQTTTTQTTQTTQAHSSHAAAHHSARRQKKKSKVPQPLKWTPHLGQKPSNYIFPVDGGASYIDTYGANRSDIYDGWHHGDDLFAPLGTPVVAVADGKLSLVGWNSLGGWRIWLTDAKGNSFYYAHLSGYSRWILHHRNVKAGQVIGFLGRTGDAFTTTPHLHFEIHPHQLLKLGYDGAVDPTTYLKSWRVETLPAAEIPQPARLDAPKGSPAEEASVVWKQLIAARHLQPNGEPVVGFAVAVHRPFPATQEASRRIAAVRTAAHVEASEAPSDGPWPLLVLVVVLVASIGGAVFTARRRRDRSPEAPLH